LGAGVLSWKFVGYSRTPSPPTPLPQRGEGRVDFTTLAPWGERVDRIRRFHQPGREGGPTFCLSWGGGGRLGQLLSLRTSDSGHKGGQRRIQNARCYAKTPFPGISPEVIENTEAGKDNGQSRRNWVRGGRAGNDGIKMQAATQKRPLPGYPQKLLKTNRQALKSRIFDRQFAAAVDCTGIERSGINLARTFWLLTPADSLPQFKRELMTPNRAHAHQTIGSSGMNRSTLRMGARSAR